MSINYLYIFDLFISISIWGYFKPKKPVFISVPRNVLHPHNGSCKMSYLIKLFIDFYIFK